MSRPTRHGWVALLLSTLARAVLILLVALLFWAVAPAAIGWRPTVVSSGSMMPRLQVGDVAISRPVPARDARPGQILLVDDPDHPGRLRMHRFVRTTPDGRLILRGDANRTDDSTPVSPAAVRGVGVLLVPYVARPVTWLAGHDLRALLLGALALGALVAAAFWYRLPADDTDPRDTDPRDTGPRDTGPHATGPHATGPQATGPRDTDPRDTGPRGPGRRVPAAAPVARLRRPARGAVLLVGALIATVAVAAPAGAVAVFSGRSTNPQSNWAAANYFTCTAVAASSAIGTPQFYFPLGDAGGPAVTDISGNNYPGTYQNTSGITFQVAGPCPRDNRTAVTLDGSSGYLSTSRAVLAPQTYTESIWFRTTTTSGGILLTFGSTSSGSTSAAYGRTLYMNNAGQIVFYVWNGSPQIITSPGTYNDGAWHMATGVASSTTGTRLYVDGTLIAANPSITVEDTFLGYWRIGWDGTWYAPSSLFFAGSLADAAVWSSVLTDGQISSMYVAGTPTGSGTCSAAVAAMGTPTLYYPLGERSGTTVTDASGNGRNGTYYNGTTFDAAGPCPRDYRTAVTLNGSSQYLSANGSVPPTQALTESVWFRTTSSAGGDLMSFGDTGSGGNSAAINRQLSMVSGGRINYHTDGPYNLISSASYNDGTWHMATATMSPAGPQLYVDGALVAGATAPTSLIDFTGTWRLGGDTTESGATSQYLGGSLAQAVVFPAALSAAQIRTLYTAGT